MFGLNSAIYIELKNFFSTFYMSEIPFVEKKVGNKNKAKIETKPMHNPATVC